MSVYVYTYIMYTVRLHVHLDARALRQQPDVLFGCFSCVIVNSLILVVVMLTVFSCLLFRFCLVVFPTAAQRRSCYCCLRVYMLLYVVY